jgi:hypothetical protein
MKITRHLGALIGVLAVCLLFSPTARAADPPGPPAHAAMQGHDEGDMQQSNQAHMQQLMGLVHDALALRSDQEASWRTFMASMAPPAAMMSHGDEAHDRAMLTTPQMLDRMAEHMRREQAEFERHAAAVRQFYTVLSPTQQRTFDALMMLMHHGMGMHGMGAMEMRGMNMHEDHDGGSMMH